MLAVTAADPAALLDFWFGAPDDAGRTARRVWWFAATPAIDEAVRAQFADWVEPALRGDWVGWESTAEGALALILILDQIPRHLHRGSAAAFAADPTARAVADRALARGWDQAVPPAWRLFFYLPFEHSEDLADQIRSLALFTALGDPLALDYAQRHYDVIARFGRFPHRNAALGRANRVEEVVFLLQPGSSF